MSKELIDFIFNDENTKAEDEFENLMADKIGNLVDRRKIEVANTIYSDNKSSDDSDNDEVIEEDVDLLKNIVETKKDQVYEFKDGSSVSVDVQTASLLLIVYESLDSSNQKKFEEKVYKSKKSFLELVDFAQKKIG